ncbi:hypothetical protein C922_00436, partial [Plasmodium inui San Antonio 1]
ALLKDENNYYIYKDSWIEHFNKSGYSVYGIDLQGHGQSDGYGNLKANVKEYDDMVYDVIQYINEIHDKVSSYGDNSADSSSSSDENCEEVPSTSNRSRGTLLCVKGTEKESQPPGKTEGKLSDSSGSDKSSGGKDKDKSSKNNSSDKSSSNKRRDKWYNSKKGGESCSSKMSDGYDSRRSHQSSGQISDKSFPKKELMLYESRSTIITMEKISVHEIKNNQHSMTYSEEL